MAAEGTEVNENTGAEGSKPPEGDSTAITEGVGEALRSAQGENKAGEDKEGGDKSGADAGAPKAYEDFKIPDEMKIDSEQLTQFHDIARKFNLTQESAQELVDMQVGFSKDVLAKNVEIWKETTAGWLKESKADAEIGGQKYEESIEVSQRALKQFGTPALVELLETYGLGNHPEMIRFTSRVGAALGEDKIVSGSGSGDQQKSVAERIFGKTQ